VDSGGGLRESQLFFSVDEMGKTGCQIGTQ